MNDLKTLAGNQNFTAGGFTLEHSERLGAIDYKRFIDDHKLVVDEKRYRKESVEVWKVSLVLES